MKNHIARHIGVFTLLALILLLAAWIRTLGLSEIPEGQFTENDAYLYYWQADIIAEQGRLPQRDMHRWMPLGRDLSQTLNFFSYVTAYTYKLITLFFPNITLYQVHLFAPVVCFVIGMGVLCLFLYRVFGFDIAVTVGILLALMPGCLERSAAGCSDRDCWCWLLGILAVISYLWKEQVHRPRSRLIFSGISGLFIFLGGLSWEGFGVFVLVILALELWRFVTSESEKHLIEYLVWVLMFAPWLYLTSPAYRQGIGFSTHLAALVLIPPIAVLALRYLRYFLTTYISISEWIQQRISGRAVALVLTAGCLLLGAVYVLTQAPSFTLSTVPFGSNRLMQNVRELEAPQDVFWRFRYGTVLLLGSFGLIGGCIRMWGKQGAFLAVAVCALILSTFFRNYLYTLLSPLVCEYLFYIGIAFVPIAALGVATLQRSTVKNENVSIAIAVWFLIWLVLAREARRYEFFIGFPLALFAAACLRFIAAFLSEHFEKYMSKHAEIQSDTSQTETSQTTADNTKKRRFRRRKPKPVETEISHKKPLLTPSLLKTVIISVMLTLLLFWQPPASTEPGSLAKRAVLTVKKIRVALPGRETPQGIDMENALRWMKAEHSEKKNGIVAAGWSYGSVLNVLGEVKTIIDQDHFIQHWIHLYSRHVFCAQSEREALEFLKTHDATYLMLTESEVLNPMSTSAVGSNEKSDRQFDLEAMRSRIPLGSPSKYRMLPDAENASIKSIDINFAAPVTVTAKLKTGKNVNLPYIAVFGQGKVKRNQCNEHKNGGILHYFDEIIQRDVVYYIPPHGWNSLAVKLFFQGVESRYFVPVYPQKKFFTAKVKVWEIHYPPDIKKNQKYLATFPKEKDKEE